MLLAFIVFIGRCMVFRITNELSEEDYKTIVETLSDKKALG